MDKGTQLNTKKGTVVRFRGSDEDPDTICKIISDMAKRMQARSMRPHHQRRRIDEILYCDENVTPMKDILPVLLDEMAGEVEEVCEWTNISTFRMSEILRGAVPTVEEILMISASVCKPPAFFVEYRRARVIQAFAELVESDTNLAALYRKLEIGVGNGRSR